MPRIVEVKVLTKYRLHVRFDDDVEGAIDLSGMVGNGVFAGWSDPDFFAQVVIDPETKTVAWPGGIDLCPDQLYHDLTGAPLPGAPVQTR